MPRGKKNAAAPVDDRTYDLATFGETEFNIPDRMVDKTKRGYTLVSPLTKSGKISTRHGVPSIKLHPVHEIFASVISSKTDRYKLSEFVKQSKLQLEEQHKKLTELQEKIVEAEVKETMIDLLQKVEIRNMAKKEPEEFVELVNAVEEEVRNEIVEPVAAVKKPRKKAEPKEKKVSLSQLNEKLNYLHQDIKGTEGDIKILTKKVLEDMRETLKKRLADGVMTFKEKMRFMNLVDKNKKKYDSNFILSDILENKFNLIDEDTLTEYSNLQKKSGALDREQRAVEADIKSLKAARNQRKKIETEVQETMIDLLQNVENRNMAQKEPVAAAKKPRKKAEPKEKKVSLSQLKQELSKVSDDIYFAEADRNNLVYKLVGKSKNPLDWPHRLNAKILKMARDGIMNMKTANSYINIVERNAESPESFYPALLNSKYKIIDDDTRAEYDDMTKKIGVLYKEKKRINDEINSLKKPRKKAEPKKKTETAFTGLSSTNLKEAREEAERLAGQEKEMIELKRILNQLSAEEKESRPAPTYDDSKDID
jgi:hypothetical protein